MNPTARIFGFIELMKPELTGLSVLTAVFAYLVAARGTATLTGMLGMAFGTFLVGGACGTLNQYIERDRDALMRRTERRPLPSGRIRPSIALLYGIVLGIVGLAMLEGIHGRLPALCGALTLLLYLAVYTPLKRVTAWNTVVGAIPGALPTLIGWTGGMGRIDTAGWVFFSLLYVWQFPHFLSLAWLYRKDYAKAGFRMLVLADADSALATNRANILSCLILIPLTLSLSSLFGLSPTAIVFAVCLSVGFFWLSWRVWLVGSRSSTEGAELNRRTRQLFFGSLAYLPLLMAIGLIDRV